MVSGVALDEFTIVDVALGGVALFAGRVEHQSGEEIGRSARHTIGYCGTDLRLDGTPTDGIVVRHPAAAVVSWSRVGEIVAAGLGEDLLAAWRGGYHRYCQLVGAYSDVRQHPGGIDGFYAEYCAASEAMTAAQREMIRRGLEALRPTQGALF